MQQFQFHPSYRYTWRYAHLLVLITVLSLFSGVLSACGGGSTDTVTLHVMVSSQPIGGHTWWQNVVKHFQEANPNITVKLNYQPDLGTANTFATTAVQTGTPLDVATVQEAATVTMMQKNALEPLDSYIQGDSNFNVHVLAQSMVAEATMNKHIYGIPFYEQPEARQYNKDLFAKAGVQPPQNYQDLLSVCQALQKVGVATPLYEDRGGYPALGDWTSWGAFPLSADGQKAEIYPKMMAWATFYHDLAWKYHCTDPQIDEGGKGTTPATAFSNGKLAWHNFASISFPGLSAKDLNVSGWSLPEAGPSGRAITIGGSHLVIPRTSKNKAEAWKFISFVMTSKVDQKAIALQLHDLPSMASLANDPDIMRQTPQFVPFLQELTMKTVAAPNVPWYYEITYGTLYNHLLNMIRDPDATHIAGYLQQAQSEAEAAIAKDKQIGG